MFSFFSKQRFHESVALAALFAASITLHVAWISNLLVARVPFFQQWFTLAPSVGPVSGLYAKSLFSFLVIFFCAAWYWRGKDCSHARKHLFQFFLISLLTFFLMTLPFVYQFSVTVES
ncbi:MAG: hypothetical protein AAB664_02710 [Patescibacteria group bacterium]